jgi:hypothetical protein
MPDSAISLTHFSIDWRSILPTDDPPNRGSIRSRQMSS